MDATNPKDTGIQLSENALAVLRKRYLKKDEQGEPAEQPIDMIQRVADNIAEAEYRFSEGEQAQVAFEKWRRLFAELMTSRKFMPNSPTLMNAGRDLQQLSACFVLPVEDSIEDIYEALKQQALIHKSGGGTGFSFSRLRPKGDTVQSTMGVSSGPVSFMSVFDSSTEHIKQGGTRRGANMGILRVDHPDIEEFVAAKHEGGEINNFNISVAITDEFMEAVEADSDFDLRSPRDAKVHSTIRASDLFDQIVEGAWRNGEPGVVFIDRINDDNPTRQFPIESTNPCSEAHLPPYDSCNLGSINLARFVHHPAAQTNGSSAEPDMDWDELRQSVRVAVRFLDNVVEMNRYPLDEIAAMSRGNRRIGLGVMGFADALIDLGIAYDSEEGLAFAEEVMAFIDEAAWQASRELAEERGVYSNWEDSRHGQQGDRVRNSTVTTIAPTGTISLIAGCSGGIEPLYAIAFKRRQAGMELTDVNPRFVEQVKERGLYSEELMERVAHSGSVVQIEELPRDLKNIWRTASDIEPPEHIRMQAVFQRYTSMGISKTINLPNEDEPADVADAYMQAYRTGCKGIAVYRDGSREEQVLSTGKTASSGSDEKAPLPTEGSRRDLVPLAEARNGRPRTLTGVTKKLTTGHGPLYVSLNNDEYGPRECFVVLGKPGGTASAFSDALGRMISLAEKHGATPEEVHHQLSGIQDGHPAGVGPNAILSVPDGVAKAISEHYLAEEQGQGQRAELPVIGACPDCGAALVRREGCLVCMSCSYSKCD